MRLLAQSLSMHICISLTVEDCKCVAMHIVKL